MPRDRVHLYLLRHGEPVRTNCLYGHLDLELSPRGQAQAQAQARAMAAIPLAAAASSDLVRARVGLDKLLAAQASTPPAQVTEQLREMCMGRGEGLAYGEARTHFPMLHGRGYGDLLDVRLPEGESMRDVYERVLPWLQAFVAERYTGGEQSLALVAHNAVNRLILAHCTTGKPDCYGRFDQGYGCINRIDLDMRDPARALDRATIVYTNLTRSLPQLDP